MIRLPRMAMVGAAGRNSGKTEFACSLIRRFGGRMPIVAIKVTPEAEPGFVHGGDGGKEVRSSPEGRYRIIEERDRGTGKDTSRLLAAGASSVYWLRVSTDYLEEALSAVLDLTGTDDFLVCESSGLRLVAEPGLFFLVRNPGVGQDKPSAARVRRHADLVVHGDGTGFDVDLADIGTEGGRWTLRLPATAVIVAGSSVDAASASGWGPGCEKALVERFADALRPWFRQILVGCFESKRCRFVDLPTVPWTATHASPLQVVVSGLRASEYDRSLVIGCDALAIDIDSIRAMLREAVDHDAVVAGKTDAATPAVAVYNRRFLSVAEGVLATDDGRLDIALEQARTLRL